MAGTENADGNFATVGHQHLLDFFGLHDPSPLSVSWTFVCTYYIIDLPRLAEGKQHKSPFCSLSQGRRGFSPQIWKLFPLPPAVGIKKPYQKLPPALSRYSPAPFFRRNVRNESYRRVGFLHKRSPSPHPPKALKRHQRRIPNRGAALMVNKGRKISKFSAPSAGAAAQPPRYAFLMESDSASSWPVPESAIFPDSST